MNEFVKAWQLAFDRYNRVDSLPRHSTHLHSLAGSMGRTAEDLIMLDSIVRTKNYSSSGEGMLPGTVPCDVNVNTNLSLAGLRIGLPSTFGELTVAKPNTLPFALIRLCGIDI